ncbi:hypothetical protein NVV95_11175 [Herbiconiux sp. CPCC 205716]|uniref:Uncharacterized protein n=1 Tax=Herbiconiux gentiana TaxID=2970912 RepID=A0ABT2GFV0_9MICO|nr:hypothetical protein [Herbiconiux gentiana]MCS5715113.1 hypothetical protein [Herbiconiux gentiana]
MRRREKVAKNGGLPARLAVFDQERWEGRDDAERYAQWMRARNAWAEARGIEVLPGDDEAWAAFPDGVFRPEDI